MRFDDAALNTGDKPEASYNQFGGTVGGPHQEEQGLLLRQLRVHPRPPDRRPHRDGAAAGDAAGRPVVVADRRSTIRCRGTRTAPGARSSGYSPATRTTRCATPRPIRTASTSFPRRAWTDRQEDREPHSRPTTSTGTGNNYFVSGPFKFDRHQVDSKVDYNVNSKFNLAGTFGVLHYRTSCRRSSVTSAVGGPIGGSSNPGHGHGNTYRLTVMGTYIFTPDVPHGRALRVGKAGDELGTAGARHEHR